MDLAHTLRETYSRVRRGADRTRIDIERNALYDLLADSRRRFVIERLADRDAESCANLAVDIAATETHMPKEQVPRRRVEPVREDLRNEQLPRLTDAGIVEWSKEDDEIRPGHSLDGISSLLREADRRVSHASSSRESKVGADISISSWSSQRSNSDGGRNHQ